MREAWVSKLLYDLVDPTLGDQYNMDEFVSLVELALWCVKVSSFERPFMRQVVQTFRELGLMAIEHPQLEPDLSLAEVCHIQALEVSHVAPLLESSSVSCTNFGSQFLSEGLRSRPSTI